MNYVKTLLTLSIVILVFSCADSEQKQEQDTLFELLSPEQSGLSFVNEVYNQKDFNIFKYRNFYNGGGVAIGDINNDSLPDIYLTANMGENKLFLNKGNLVFEDITASAGVGGFKPWSTGVVMADINADGLLDIYVSNAGNLEGNNHDNDLYINNGDLTFTESAKAFNLSETGFSTHASFFDYDLDGDLDAYILNNSNIPVSSLGYAAQREVRAQDWEGVPHIFKGVGDMLLRNDGGTFTDVSEEAGIYGSLIGFGLGVMVTDFNKDLYPDIYVSNDFYERDYLYINNTDGTFTESIKEFTNHLSLSAMGIDIADINNDGNNDIFVTDMLPEAEQRVKSVMEFEGYNVFQLKQEKDFFQQYIQNTLQLNNGNQTFSEIAYYSGIHATDWSWAGLIFDMDNDGFKDIFITNGINHDLTDLDFVDFFANEIIQKMALTGRKESIDSIINKMPVKPQPNYAYKNLKSLKFENANKEWGFDRDTRSNGAAYADLDLDGDLDLVINNVNEQVSLYKNTSDELDNNYIQVELNGPEKNLFAVGSSVIFYIEDQIIYNELIPSRGFQSSISYPITQGLGTKTTVDSIRVIWPDRKSVRLDNVAANQRVYVDYDPSHVLYEYPSKKTQALFKAKDNSVFFTHQENSFNDFDQEGLLYNKLSEEGPAFAVGDINADGLEDLFVGGGKGQSAQIYLQKKNAEFTLKRNAVFQKDAAFEDTAATLVDIDGDSDLDLVVGSGGNQQTEMLNYKTRIYLNDGRGNFNLSEQVLPSNRTNISVIKAADYDNDGDQDLFIGSRSVAGVYGVDPNHLLLENNGKGQFEDVSKRNAFDLKNAGMVTDALWVDINTDGNIDLITVSDWGSPKIFQSNGKQLILQSSELDELTGWWNTIESVDIDKDGDLDFVLGNQGENIHYKPSQEQAIRMFINDFDANGSIEQIVCIAQENGDYPIHQKREITAQLVSLKKQNLKASDYARRNIQDLFGPDLLRSAIVKEVRYSSSILLINENGSFTSKALPPRAQFSCICDISCSDVNNDGHLDLITVGNDHEFKPQFSRLDASYGDVFLGDGQNNFTWMTAENSGISIKGEAKHLAKIKSANNKELLVVIRNNMKPLLYEAQ